jgi:hypothetical protein
MFFGHQTSLNINLFQTMIFLLNSFSPRIYVSNDVSYASNEDSMPKLRPREIDVPIYPDRAHILVFHLLRLGF